jgi:hypothetical protein
MKKFLLLPLLAIFLVACDNTPQTHKEKQQHWLHYYKDTRTDLCFAGYHLGGRDGFMTQVPCSPEVEKLVKPWDDFYDD